MKLHCSMVFGDEYVAWLLESGEGELERYIRACLVKKLVTEIAKKLETDMPIYKIVDKFQKRDEFLPEKTTRFKAVVDVETYDPHMKLSKGTYDLIPLEEWISSIKEEEREHDR